MSKHHIYNNGITKVVVVSLLAILFLSCDREKKEIRDMCSYMHLKYPQATLQDIYKTCYQDYFGAEHLMSDTAAARMYLHEELEEFGNTDMSAMPKEEPTGFRHRFKRINLSNVVEGELTEDQLLGMFIDAAAKDNTYGDDWEKEWSKIVRIALRVNPDWFDPELMQTLHEAAKANQAVRHSDAFRKAYNPHYRIVRQNTDSK